MNGNGFPLDEELLPETREFLTLLFQEQALLLGKLDPSQVVAQHFIPTASLEKTVEILNQVVAIQAVLLLQTATNSGLDLAAFWEAVLYDYFADGGY